MRSDTALSTYRQQGIAATAALAAYRQHLQQSAIACLARLRCKTTYTETPTMNPEPKSTSPIDPSMLRSYPGPKPRNPEKERVSASLKEQINNLLWAVLPPSTTLYDADELAAKWYAEVMNRWEREDAEEKAREDK